LTARIDLGDGASGPSIRVAGRLDEPAARELLDVCRHRPGVLLVDLAELTSADRFAIEALRRIRSQGARIVGASPYITLLLDGEPVGPAAATKSRKHKEDE